ncbi:MAG: ATP-binding cassette domain-containing protein [Treponema sp.]
MNTIRIDELKTKNKVIVSQFNAEIHNGSHVAIIGRNGIGKSSLFRAIVNRQRYKGKMDIPKDKIAIIGDYVDIPQELFVKDVLNLKDKQHHLIAENLNLSLEKISTTKIKHLSSGEKRKILLVTVFSQNKSFFLFDELINGLDVKSVKDVNAFFNDYFNKNYDKSFIYITHRLEEINAINFNEFWVFTDTGMILKDKILNKDILSKYY